MSVSLPQCQLIYRQLFLVILSCLFGGAYGDTGSKPTSTLQPEQNPVEQVAGQWEERFTLKDYVPQSPLEKSLYVYFQQLLKACGMAAGGDMGDISRIMGRVREHLAGEREHMIRAFVEAGYRRADAEGYFDRLDVRLRGDLARYFGRRSPTVLKPAKPEDAQVADDFYAKAEELLNQKRDLVGSLKALDDALRFAPNNARVALDTALRQLVIGQLAEARANFDLARERYPKVVNIYIGLGTVRGAAGDYLGAIVDFTTAIYLQPGASRAYSMRGMARQALDDYEGAIDDYGLQIASGYPVGLGRVYVRRGQAYYTLGNLENARADFEAAVRADPTYAPAYRELGIIHTRQGDPKASLAALNKAVELQPDNSEGYSSRIWVHLDLGDNESALRDADRMVAMDQDTAFLHMIRAALLDVINQPESAEAEYREAIALAKRSRDTISWYYANFALDMFLRLRGRADLDYLKDVLEWSDDWPKRIALHLSGRITAESLLNAAKQAPTRSERMNHGCEANYYIGMALWSAGNHQAAGSYLRSAAAPQYVGNLEYTLARKLLREADAPAADIPAKPNNR